MNVTQDSLMTCADRQAIITVFCGSHNSARSLTQQYLRLIVPIFIQKRYSRCSCPFCQRCCAVLTRSANAAALAPIRLTNAASQLPYGSGETKGVLLLRSQAERKAATLRVRQTERPLERCSRTWNTFCQRCCTSTYGQTERKEASFSIKNS